MFETVGLELRRWEALHPSFPVPGADPIEHS